MKAGGGKQKGNSFENKIAKILSEWISDGESKDLFCRSPASGAKATINFKLGESYADQAGDIIATGEKGFRLTKIFFIELKHYADLNVEGLVYGTKSGIIEFWDKACKEAQEHGKLPMLIAKQNRKSVLLALDVYGASKFDELIKPKIYVYGPGIYLYSFDEFMAKVHHSALGI